MKQKLLLLAIFSFFFVLNASAESIGLKVIDTIAGYPTSIQTARTDANTNITVKVEKPDGGVIQLPARTNSLGYASLELDGYHTKKAGLYKAYAVTAYGESLGVTNFQVFAGSFSPVKSKIVTDKASLSAKKDRLIVQVAIRDQYDNPIKNHLITLLSSRTEDKISYDGSKTSNEKGIVVFNVQSSAEGVSVFTAIDQTNNQDIYERKKVVFYAPSESFAFGGNDFSASLTGNTSTSSSEYRVLDHFEIEFPNTVEVDNDSNHLKVIAQDADGNTVQSYTGTIRIAVTGDDNAIIPNEGEYTFTTKDQGEKTFALAMVFTQVGSVKIEVFDYANNKINTNLKGEKIITVVAQKTETDSASETSTSEIVIKSPVNGSEVSNANITVSGLAVPNTNLKLMLDDMKVAEIQSDMEGFFAYTLRDIEDGQKEVYVVETEGMRRASAPVQFTVDATPPRIDTLNIFPEESIAPKDSYTITVYSEPKLDYAKARIAGVEEPLTESAISPGKYEGTFFAPQSIGDYKIDIVLADRMGNSASYTNQKTLHVVDTKANKPMAPQNLKAEPSDGQIKLTWSKVPSTKVLDHYKVYVGELESSMEVVTQSKSEKALLGNIENDKEYFIAVSAVDSEGAESEMSEVLKVKPLNSLPGTPENVELRGGDGLINVSWDEPTTGAEVKKYTVYIGYEKNELYPIKTTNKTSTDIVGLQNGTDYFIAVAAISEDGTEGSKSDAEKGTPESLHGTASKSPLRAMAGDSKVTLSWDAFSGAENYKILFGIKSNVYEGSILSTGNATSYVVTDLMNGFPYYFTVIALDANNLPLSERYPEAKATPTGFGFKIIAGKKVPLPSIQTDKVEKLEQTGPETWIFLAFSLAVAGTFFFFKKRGTLVRVSSAPRASYAEPARKKIQF